MSPIRSSLFCEKPQVMGLRLRGFRHAPEREAVIASVLPAFVMKVVHLGPLQYQTKRPRRLDIGMGDEIKNGDIGEHKSRF
jgi:hypothetical protein